MLSIDLGKRWRKTFIMASTEERFISIETKIAYQEKLIAELNEVILERGKQIDLLTRRITQLERLATDDGPEQPGHERPPHY